MLHGSTVAKCTLRVRSSSHTKTQELKTRHAAHKTSMRHERYANSTQHSKYVWQLSSQDTEFNLSQTILELAKSYYNAGKRCNLCIAEAYNHVLHADKEMAVNKRIE